MTDEKRKPVGEAILERLSGLSGEQAVTFMASLEGQLDTLLDNASQAVEESRSPMSILKRKVREQAIEVVNGVPTLNENKLAELFNESEFYAPGSTRNTSRISLVNEVISEMQEELDKAGTTP